MCNSKGTFFFFSSLPFHNFLKGRRLEHSKFGPRGSGFFFSLPSMVVAFILFYSFFSCTIKQREEKEEGTTNWLDSVRVIKEWKRGGGIPDPSSISCRGVGCYLKVGGQGVMWRAQYFPSGSDRLKWSAKIWAGNCPLYPPISYAPDYVIDFIHDFFYLNPVFKSLTTSLS